MEHQLNVMQQQQQVQQLWKILKKWWFDSINLK
jgi:hypothetical protein